MANPGTSTYPGTLDAFDTVTTGVTYEDDSGYAHTVLHNQSQDADEKIESVLGTTLGTSVLKNFAAGEFPVRNTGGAATGTLTQTLVGGTFTSPSIGSPTVTGTVQGTTYFANFPETVGTPTTNNQLTNKLYVDSNIGGAGTTKTLVNSPSNTLISANHTTYQTVSGTLSVPITSGTNDVILFANAHVDNGSASILAYIKPRWNTGATPVDGEERIGYIAAAGVYDILAATQRITGVTTGTYGADMQGKFSAASNGTYYRGQIIAIVIPQ